jgi:hypothetical protein
MKNQNGLPADELLRRYDNIDAQPDGTHEYGDEIIDPVDFVIVYRRYTSQVVKRLQSDETVSKRMVREARTVASESAVTLGRIQARHQFRWHELGWFLEEFALDPTGSQAVLSKRPGSKLPNE